LFRAFGAVDCLETIDAFCFFGFGLSVCLRVMGFVIAPAFAIGFLSLLVIGKK